VDDAAFGAASPVVPKFISYSDPASQWTGARGGPAYFAYSTNYLIDTDNAVILDVEPSRSIRQAEVGVVRTMIDRVRKTHGLKPERLIADTAYGSGPMLDWLVEKRGIAPHIPVIDKSGRKDGTFERADFTFDAENDLYICPSGKELMPCRRAFTKPIKMSPSATVPGNLIVRNACSNNAAHPKSHNAKLRAQFTNLHVKSHAPYHKHSNMPSRESYAKRLKCRSSI
jgi:hypothetical protein